MQGWFPAPRQTPSVLHQRFKAHALPSRAKDYVVVIFPCDCVAIQQVRSLRAGNQKWQENNKGWKTEVSSNCLRGAALQCPVCSGAGSIGKVGAAHRAALEAIKQHMRKASSTWFVCVEVPLELGVQSSPRVDVLLVSSRAQTWAGTVAIEINPKQHDVEPIRHGLSPGAAAQRADRYDEAKHDRCCQLGMRFMTLWVSSSSPSNAISAKWLGLLNQELSMAE